MNLSPDQYHDDAQPLDDDTLDAVAVAIQQSEEEWLNYAFLATPKMPCPECGGTGKIYAGSLGDACPGCGGARAVDRPDAPDLDRPDFVSMRRALGAYTEAQKDAELPEGHIAKRHLALPPASTIPRVEVVVELGRQASEMATKLPEPNLSLPDHKREAAGMLGEGGAEFSDEDLDELEE